MKLARIFPWLIVTLIWMTPQNSVRSEAQIPAPAAHFGFQPGSDGMLFDYEQLVAYLEKLDAASPRVKLQRIGQTPMAKPMYILFISSEENIKDLDTLKAINRRLALEDRIPDGERDRLIEKGRVFFLSTLSMHSDEVGPAQAVPAIAYGLAVASDPETVDQLEKVVVMIVPNHNPDGMDMVVQNYRKYKGTKYEGCTLPAVYHKYVGHDNNRDFVNLTQSDTKAIAWIYNQEWFPQVMIEKHQMWTSGPRYFVPPAHDPIAENVDAGIWTWTGIFGSAMARDMAEKNLAGVTQHYAFDDYWPGSTETCIWKNVIGMLTECASVKDASPVFVEPNELAVGGKGLAEYKKSINMPLPWPGGWWRLSDIVQYEIVSTLSIVKTCALNRSQILRFRNDLCRSEIRRGMTEPPGYFILPASQKDPGEWARLIRLLQEHGVECHRTDCDLWAEGQFVRTGDAVVTLAQPFRPFIKEVLEKQTFPVRHYSSDGRIIRPYDVTSWSLPLHAGVRSWTVNARSESLESHLVPLEAFSRRDTLQIPAGRSLAYSSRWNDGYHAAFIGLAEGAGVYRLKNPIPVGRDSLPEGSFVLAGAEKCLARLKKLDVSPVALDQWKTDQGVPVVRPRIALVESYMHDMDAGWTRFLFDTYDIPFEVIHPGDFKNTEFRKRFDVVVFPDQDKNLLMEGKYKSGDQMTMTDYPPEFTKGIEKEGMKSLLEFIEAGGIVVAWGGSCDLFMGVLSIERSKTDKEEFQLPIRSLEEDLKKKEFFCPGSLLRVQVTPHHPVTYGMEPEIGVFSQGGPVFQTSQPIFDMDRRVLGKYPEKQILLSGYCEKEEAIGNKTAMVWIRKGKGQLVLFGFGPQFRSSTPGTYKLLFNALLLPKL
jgi:hypothetical protein